MSINDQNIIKESTFDYYTMRPIELAPTGIELEGSNILKIYHDRFPRSERKL